jgi:transcriptional antiterminator RfaH
MANMISDNKRWYTVYSKPQKEEFAEFNLQLKGIRVFYPKLMLPESAKKQRRIVPLFPSYLFVHIDIFSDEHAYVTWSPGVKHLVSFNDTPVAIDDPIIDFLMQQATPNGHIPASSNLKPGQEVRINGGPFDGLTGLIQEPPDAKGRVKVLMRLLSRQLQVEVPVRFVECEWVV